MNPKYLEYIVVYLSVLVGCVLLGTCARLFVINIGADEFTAGIVFWAVTILGVITYAILALLIDGLYMATVRWFFRKKKQSKLFNLNLNNSEKIEQIRTEQQQLNDKIEKDKKDIAVNYTQQEFAAYCSDEDLDLLCQYVILYSENKSLKDIRPIIVKDLSNLDLYHFGWNIWNHFKVSKQIEVASFLKKVFPELLNDVEKETIKRHLKDDELKGVVKIRKSLSM
ncbi:mobilization protein [Labilibacter sediminis]|nr:mobilization protein [Labilibacter sediminis]